MCVHSARVKPFLEPTARNGRGASVEAGIGAVPESGALANGAVQVPNRGPGEVISYFF